MAITITDADQVPLRCALFLVDGITGAPLEGVPVYAHAVVDLPQAQGLDVPLGLLGTDHVGFASWDLEPVRHLLRGAGTLAQGDVFKVSAIWAEVSGPAGVRIDLARADQARSGSLAAHGLLDPEAVLQRAPGSLPSLQNAALADWHLSPASFSYLPVEVIGESGETLLPSTVASSHYSLFEVRGFKAPTWVTIEEHPDYQLNPITLHPGTSLTELGVTKPKPDAKTESLLNAQAEDLTQSVFGQDAEVAVVTTYDVTWTPIGHGLGEVVYSLPLAPAEMVRVAIIDWARTSTDAKTQQTTSEDVLNHDQARDRSIDEVVEASVKETQGGFSAMFGLVDTLLTGGLAGKGAKSLGFGAGISGSGGDRSTSAHTTNKLLDQFRQHSTQRRQQTASVVVTSSQAESTQGKTRVVRNYNHSHAMTVLYYEVLRHFRVTVSGDTGRPALLVQRTMHEFSPALIFSHRRVLERTLLDPRLAPALDIAERLWALSLLVATPPPDLAGEPIRTFVIYLRTGKQVNPPGGWYGAAVKYVDPSDGITRWANLLRTSPKGDMNDLSDAPMMTLPDHDEIVFAVLPDVATDGTAVPPGLCWRDLSSLTFSISLAKYVDAEGNDKPEHCDYTFFRVDVETTGGHTHIVVDDHQPPTVADLGMKDFAKKVILAPVKPGAVAPLDQLGLEDRVAYLTLMAHLNANSRHYWRCIWLAEDPGQRLVANQKSKVNIGGTKYPLFEVVDNVVLDVVGDRLVMPLDRNLFSSEEYGMLPSKEETLVSLPTRGVFAEAKLGSSNASELIDDDRFWDWQTSPIPEQADPIDLGALGSRAQQADLTGLPLGSGLTIVQPSSAPDPVGMANALTLLGKSDVFRNMSTAAEVSGLLGDLAKVNQAAVTPPPEKGDPKAGGPKAGDPKAGDPKAGDPKPNDPKAGDPKPNDPKAGDPKAGGQQPAAPTQKADQKQVQPTGSGTDKPTPAYTNSRAFTFLEVQFLYGQTPESMTRGLPGLYTVLVLPDDDAAIQTLVIDDNYRGRIKIPSSVKSFSVQVTPAPTLWGKSDADFGIWRSKSVTVTKPSHTVAFGLLMAEYTHKGTATTSNSKKLMSVYMEQDSKTVGGSLKGLVNWGAKATAFDVLELTRAIGVELLIDGHRTWGDQTTKQQEEDEGQQTSHEVSATVRYLVPGTTPSVTIT